MQYSLEWKSQSSQNNCNVAYYNQMKKHDQNGFIPMIVCLIVLIAAVLYVSYQHVSQVQQ
jgi:predicted PolB exonuclease-like 3'-5' exonuclease